MNKSVFSLLFLLAFPFLLRAESVWMTLDICQFADLQGNPYIETYISIDGGTLKFLPNTDKKFQAKVNLVYFLYQLNGKDSALVYGDNLNLISLEATDSTEESRRSRSLRHLLRQSVKPGKYVLIAEVRDANLKNAKPVTAMYELEVEARNPNGIDVSDIELISGISKSEQTSPFVKNGYEIIPFNTNGYYVDKDEMQFYLEIYNSKKSFENEYFVRSQILKAGKVLFEYSKTAKKTPADFDVFTFTYNIAKLPTDDYELQILVMDNKNQAYRKVSKPFSVYRTTQTGPMVLTKDVTGLFDKYEEQELNNYVKSLAMIGNSSEQQISKTLANRQEKVDFIYSFFQKRVEADGKGDVAMLWNLHLNKLDYANQLYKAAFTEGWKTDRGRVMMKYGKPNNVEMFPAESNLLPYEIWRYDRLDNQTNIIFVFCDRDQATNSYDLIHSNKYGEVKNPRWRDFIMGNGRDRNKATIDFEDPNRYRYDSKIDPTHGIGEH